MSTNNCRKHPDYHDLLVQYIEQIGTVEIPSGEADVRAALADQSWWQKASSVGQVVGRDGAWELHLLRVDASGPYKLVRNKLRRFPSRQIAEIVARYRTIDRNELFARPAPSTRFSELNLN